MGDRGRKSSAENNVANFPGVKTPSPPPQLTEAQQSVWWSVVTSRGGDLITPEAHPILVEYCRAVALADELGNYVDEFDRNLLNQSGGLARWEKLLKMQERAMRSVTTLGGKLRLTPASRILPRGAGRNQAKGEKRRPWETEDE